MATLLKWLLGFLLATGLATLALYDNGTLSLVWFDWVIETSLTFALAALIAGFLLVYALVQLTFWIWHVPRNWRRRRQMKRYAKAENRLSKGLMAQETGDWHQAEKHLIATAKYSENGVMHYLAAAKMAHNQGAIDRQKHHIAQAKEAYPHELATIGLVEARLLAKTDAEEALVILAELHRLEPDHKAVLADYAQLLADQQLWSLLATLMPDVKQYHALAKDDLLTLQNRLLAGQLQTAVDLSQVEALWQSLTRGQRVTPSIVAEYVDRKRALGDETGLTECLEKALRKHWDERLVYQYGRIELGPAFTRLKHAEKWLKEHPENPVLLLTLGRLACRSQLWGQGRTFLQESLRLQPEIETFHTLAQCYEAEGLDAKAALTYKEAILQLEQKPLSQ
ncbi:MAG: heme biosynthesis HemY N-terminal domain-containing protein [Hydrogenovibrio sp.]|uniref:heme biosynthesis HemY N-terminal domain-containing protein n=1 Tax=Hydrogenovibrio sp. TaxID=2065821 RepID=UPI002870543E|nr:heme biosynthesis HemY N-terminal domain-containing protein [Hydrogenovibrio sp.]MDR9498281.1 heme biosynthesis HemY N-terminal domain-containing protein [Hydrogenovibrio sp.]